MKKVYLLFVVFVSCTSPRQSAINWKNIEHNISNEEKTAILFSLEDPLVTGLLSVDTDSALIDFFHILDLNSDGQSDVVFNGFVGAADEFLMIYIKEPQGWKKALHQFGHLEQLNIERVTTIKVFKKEAVSEDGGDSILTYQITGLMIEKISASKK